jgi:hypothetical protein
MLSFVAVKMLQNFTRHRKSPFLFDDNFTQWNNVIEYAFAELCEGHFPYWNPYQWAGFRMDEVGYYGIYNPLMFLAYLMRSVACPDTISNYVFLAYMTGVLSAWALCVKCRLGRGLRFIVPLTYACSSGYLSHASWYYVFCVFGGAPIALLLVYQVHQPPDRTPSMYWAVATGLFLGWFFYLGNAQYGCYLAFVVYFLWCVVWFTCQQKTRHATLIGGSLMAFLLSVAPLSQVYMNAARGSVFSGAPRLVEAPITDAIWGILLPYNVFAHWLPHARIYSSYGNSGGGAIAAVAVAGFVSMVISGKKSPNNGLVVGAFAAAALVVLLASGPVLLEYVPVFNRFRIAFKWLFMVPPLMLFAAILVLQRQNVTARGAAALVLGAGLYMSARHVRSDDRGVAPTDTSKRLLLDKRTLPLEVRTSFIAPAPDLGPAFTAADRIQAHRLAGNLGTDRRIFTLSGYNLSSTTNYVQDMRDTMGEDWYGGSWLVMQKFAAEKGHAQQVIREYAVCDLLGDTSDLGRTALLAGEAVEYIFGADQYHMRVKDCPGLVTNSQGRRKAFVAHTDGIEVVDVDSSDEQITARWWYSANFFLEFNDGQKTRRIPAPAGKFLRADMPEKFIGSVYFRIVDRWSVACVIFSYCILLVLLLGPVLILKADQHKRRGGTHVF